MVIRSHQCHHGGKKNQQSSYSAYEPLFHVIHGVGEVCDVVVDVGNLFADDLAIFLSMLAILLLTA